MLTRRAKAYSSYWTTTVNNDFYGGTALWCPRAQVSLNLKKSRLGPPKSMFNAENFTRSLSMSYLNWFRRNALLKCVSQPEIAKKILKKPILAFKVIQVHWICSCTQTVSLSPAISSQLILGVLTASEDRKKSPKTLYFASSGSFKVISIKVINVDTTEKLITSACCDRQHVHAYRYLQSFSRKTSQQW